MSFDQEFIIYPVGQGFFYSGSIKHDRFVKFRMVFDCGSKNQNVCEHEVELYRDEDFLQDKRIDLLVISHFDADHVNKIGALLQDGVKVKKLVMPILTFEEKLLLIMQNIEEGDADYDFTIPFIVDPIGMLSQNLDGDSEIYLIESGPEEPVVPAEIIDDESLYKEAKISDEPFEFKFNEGSIKKADKNQFNTGENQNVFLVNDSEKGSLFSSALELMEFIFYRRVLTSDDDEFYATFTHVFYENFDLREIEKLDETKKLEKIVEVVKEVKAAEIKKIFKKANADSNAEILKGMAVADLNTTALCMLHRNLPDIRNLSAHFRRNRSDRSNMHHFFNFESFGIQKFEGSRIETKVHHRRYFRYYFDSNTFGNIYPNVLLTSDSFLLSEKNVNLFHAHYQHYWDKFWLFQIPHHGSENNSNGFLHSIIPVHSDNFINYGINFTHPSNSVILSLVTTGHSAKTHPVNEIAGFKFNLYGF